VQHELKYGSCEGCTAVELLQLGLHVEVFEPQAACLSRPPQAVVLLLTLPNYPESGKRFCSGATAGSLLAAEQQLECEAVKQGANPAAV
jgi:hypothetical protein